MGRFVDLTGKKFGRLTVIEKAGKSKSGGVTWLCKCDCGNETVVRADHLKGGKIASCGCLQREAVTNPNITDEEREKGRNISDNKKWSKEVKEQANYTCDCCHKKGRKVMLTSFRQLSQ